MAETVPHRTTIGNKQQQEQHHLVATPESSPELVIDVPTMNANQNPSRTQNNETNKSESSHPPTSIESPYASPSGSDGAAPRKPHPMYPSSPFPDMQKHASNFYLPLSLGMPQFSPAAYLEHYANALQKGEWRDGEGSQGGRREFYLLVEGGREIVLLGFVGFWI